MKELKQQFFPTERPLPAGLLEEEVATWSSEHGAARLIAAAGVVGMERAVSLANRMGPYELDDDLVARLKMAGLALPAGGELSALSPSSWPSAIEKEPYGAFRSRLEIERRELLGLRLPTRHRESLVRFLRRNGLAENLGTWDLIDLARHFFTSPSLRVVVTTIPE